jgi:hypothetical protein
MQGIFNILLKYDNNLFYYHLVHLCHFQNDNANLPYFILDPKML